VEKRIEPIGEDSGAVLTTHRIAQRHLLEREQQAAT
jgi:hypothetical protein